MADAYQSYVAGRRARETSREEATIVMSAPEPKRRLHRGWKLYWGFWGAALAVALAFSVHLGHADSGTSNDWPWVAYFAVLAFLVVVPAVVIAFLAVIYIDDSRRPTHNGQPTNPWGPTQNQLLAEQNRLLHEIASAPKARPEAPRPAPVAPPAWAGKRIAGYLDSLPER